MANLNFTKLKESMTEEKFEQFCKKIALEYAQTSSTRSYFVKTYFITESCFYKILETAIVNNWVNDDISKVMEQKAFLNQKNHAEVAGMSTIKHYDTLRQKRNKLLFLRLSDEELKEMTEYFANHPECSKKQVAEHFGDLPVRVMDLVLYKAIADSIVDDSTFAIIRERSMRANPNPPAKRFFDELEKQRRRLPS